MARGRWRRHSAENQDAGVEAPSPTGAWDAADAGSDAGDGDAADEPSSAPLLAGWDPWTSLPSQGLEARSRTRSREARIRERLAGPLAEGLKAWLVRLSYGKEPFDLSPGTSVSRPEGFLLIFFCLVSLGAVAVVRSEGAWTAGWVAGCTLVGVLQLVALFTYVRLHLRTARFALPCREGCLLVNDLLLPIAVVERGALVTVVRDAAWVRTRGFLSYNRGRTYSDTVQLVFGEEAEAGGGTMVGRALCSRPCLANVRVVLFAEWLGAPREVKPGPLDLSGDLSTAAPKNGTRPGHSGSQGREGGRVRFLVLRGSSAAGQSQGIVRELELRTLPIVFMLASLGIVLALVIFTVKRPLLTPSTLQPALKHLNLPLPGENTDPRILERREMPQALQGWPNRRDGHSYPDLLLAVHMETDRVRYRPDEPLRLYLHPLGLEPGDRVAVTLEGVGREKSIHAAQVQERQGDSTFAFVFAPPPGGWTPGRHRFSVSTPWGLAGIHCEVAP